MVDVFGRTQNFAPTQFKTIEEAVITVQGVNGEDITEFLVQNFSFNYSNNIGQFFEIGSTNTYIAPGRARGQFNIGKIIGERLLSSIFGQFGTGPWSSDGCLDNNQSLSFSVTDNCDNNGERAVTWVLGGIAIANYAVNSTAEQLILQETASGIFVSLDVKESITL